MTFDTRTMAVTSSSDHLMGEDPMTVEFESVKNPLPSDILCGKNKICIKHEGSKRFRRIIEGYTAKYQQASSRNEKMEVTKEIFDKLQTRRFLKYNEETDMWETLHPLAVRDKIGHALRFSNRKGSSSIRKQVRRSSSDIMSLQDAEVAKMRSSMSMGCMDVMRGRSSSKHLRSSTGNMPFPAQSTGLHDFQATLPPLTAFSLGGVMQHNMHKSQTNAVFPSRVGSCQVGPSKDNDLSWMMQMPLLDMDSEGQVCFVNGHSV